MDRTRVSGQSRYFDGLRLTVSGNLNQLPQPSSLGCGPAALSGERGKIYDYFGFYAPAFATGLAFNLISLVIVAGRVLLWPQTQMRIVCLRECTSVLGSAPRRREPSVREDLTRIIVDRSGSWRAARSGNRPGRSLATKAALGG